MKKPDGRFWEIDLIRGISIILMVIIHFIQDLNYFGIIHYKLWLGPFDYLSKTVASIFFLLVGISLIISNNKLKAKNRLIIRGVKLIGLAMIITIVSIFVIPERFVVFGVLHCIGVSIILSSFLVNKRVSPLIIGIIVILIGFLLRFYITVDYIWLIPLGALPPEYYSIDFFPLFPWLGLVLVGISLGHYLYPEGKRRFDIREENGIIINISFLGRHSIHIYFLHQPILVSIIFLVLQPLL